MKHKYPLTSRWKGILIRWRMEGSRPVSSLADKAMAEAGYKWNGKGQVVSIKPKKKKQKKP
jgi:hypothetical protein